MDHNFGEDWRNPEKIRCYMPKGKRPDVWTEKEGDTAELRVLSLFKQLPEFLGESVFLIDGKLWLFTKSFRMINLHNFRTRIQLLEHTAGAENEGFQDGRKRPRSHDKIARNNKY